MTHDWSKVFRYDSATGQLVNRGYRSHNAKAGAYAGCVTKRDGYVRVNVYGKPRLAHRIIWEMVNGLIPEGMQIDHINGRRDDNRMDNLRLVTHSGNARNTKRRRDNGSGYVGVCWAAHAGKYRAYINSEGARRYLGYFTTAEEAHQAYLAVACGLGFHENHGRDI